MISADFGQTYDYTAVAVTERRLVPVGERYQHAEEWADYPYGPVRRRLEVRQKVEQHYDLIRLDRVPLRTPYVKIAQGLVKLLQRQSKALSRMRSWTRLPAVSSNIVGTVCRFNCYDDRCKRVLRLPHTPRITSPPRV
jgi:hypothetical protein